MLFSVYPCHTKSPKDRSCICEVDYNNANNGDVISPKCYFSDGRVSGLSRHNRIYACSGTGISLFNKSFIQLMSHKMFNQMHSLFVDDSRIFVTSTGLDLLLVFCKSTYNLIGSWHPVYGKDYMPTDKDYRLLNCSNLGTNILHVNHVLCHGDNIYVSCGKSRKYYVLGSNFTTKQIIHCTNNNDPGIIHDGLFVGNSLYFTETNGVIHTYDFDTRKLESKNIGHRWIRGLRYSNGTFYVGASATDKPNPSVLQLNDKLKVVKKVDFNINGIAKPQIYSII